MGFYSCSETSTTDDKVELEVSEEVQDQVAFGYQVNQIAGTGDEIGSLTNPQEVDEVEVDFPTGAVTFLKERANNLTREAKAKFAKMPKLFKTNGETLIGSFGDTIGTKIIIASLFFDADSGFSRYQVVTTDSDPDKRVQYDSTSIIIDINELNIEIDDRFKSLYNLRRFAPVFIVQSIASEMVATDWDVEGEVTGFTATTTSEYNENRNLQKVISEITLHPDGSGDIQETYYFKDGETKVNSVSFNNNGTGTFSRTFKNGTTITGSFDNVEDDGEGSYEATTTFPSGFYLASIFKSASVLFDFIDEKMTSDYKEVITFSDGVVDSASMHLEVSKEDDYLVTEMDVTRRNGATGRLVAMEGFDITTLDGTWTTADNYYITVSAEYYADGSAWLKYDVYLNKTRYDAGADPIATGEYNFTPDGSGSGTLTHNGEVYEVDLQDGIGEISLNGAKRTINLYR